ncbi:hypothetical protein [Pseudoxanthomonas indica]|uniref:Uncharacterized protein n=2 Tax=Pseudoxanthomonas indica TaxID=428993 RepID=A0A1T5KDL6_9GAMM|nr:hypothetical protein [Pseudoxanthomonas indica]GGD48534.1 hypothetical protein GCM10007235_20580 [Pseudoxanthomonas indica]SKC61619.1 hypothetical protein SAMN06296058_1596 [Pseudoxanthomonas indica]
MGNARSDFPWDAPVGRFMLAFGSIEHTTIALLGCLPDCRIPRNASKLALGQRIEILKEVLPRYSAEEYREALLRLNVVAKLTSKRNLVAHNTVWFDIYQDGEKVLITNHLMSARDRSVRLSLAEMMTLADEVHEAARLFSEASVQVMKNYLESYG